MWLPVLIWKLHVYSTWTLQVGPKMAPAPLNEQKHPGEQQTHDKHLLATKGSLQAIFAASKPGWPQNEFRALDSGFRV